VVTLQPLDGERERPPELVEEGEARTVMQPPVDPQDPEARTVVQGGVLKRPAARDLHVLDVDWIDSPGSPSRTASSGGVPLAGPPQAGQSEVAKHALNRAMASRTPCTRCSQSRVRAAP